MFGTLASVATFLLTHEDVILAVVEALEAGATKKALLIAIREAMVAASDARMRAELAPEDPNV
jgi:hypothetical protein